MILSWRYFSLNIKYADGIITYEVRKHQNSLYLEEFVEICNLSCTISLYKPYELDIGEGFYFHIASHSFLLNPSGGIPSPFPVGCVHPNILPIHYVVSHILIPRKHNLGKISKIIVALTWSLANRVETNWISFVIHHMTRSKRKGNMLFPYSDMITKILEHIGFNFEEEYSLENNTRIWWAIVEHMHNEINN